MTTPASHKKRGKTFETDLVRWLRELGHDAERLPLAGTKDEGDIAVKVGLSGVVIIEAKAPGAGNSIDLAGWMREAETEAANYAAARNLDPASVPCLLVIKARGKGIDQAYAIKRLGRTFS